MTSSTLQTSFLLLISLLFIHSTIAHPTGNFCPPGTYLASTGHCTLCPLNTYSIGGHNRKSCTPCPPHAPKTRFEGVVDEKLCGLHHKHCPGQDYWIVPPAGVSYLPNGVCVSPIDGCPKGTGLKLWARRAVCEDNDGNVLCGRDAIFDGVDRCVSCPKGSKLVKGYGRRKWRCERCGGRSISEGGVSRVCTLCSCGFAPDYNGNRCKRVVPKHVKLEC